MKFSSLLDLSRLPWFDINDQGRLVMSDKSVGPVADLHTHLALAYLRPMSVDLHKLHPETQHYLPACCEIDLDVYINKNISPEGVKELTRDLTLRSVGRRGMRATHTVPNLEREMDETGVRASVLLPIDFPALSDNASVSLRESKTSNKLLSFGSVHPYSAFPEKKLDEQMNKGAKGIKMHPSVMLVRPDNRRARKLYDWCAQRRMIVFWHCGPAGIEPKLGQRINQVANYVSPIADNPKTTFVLGHSGARQFEQALALQRQFPNVYLETSGQSLTNVKRMVEEADPNRVVHGSDWPFYHPAISVAKILLATEGKPEIRHKFLWGNAARLLDIN